ncbi:MAG: MmgE/PrpD family protein [Desulfobacteraceae bacterium]|nr:MAG: MmgE/PrpD family protein [Desulfobacteraceae bacterium]
MQALSKKMAEYVNTMGTPIAEQLANFAVNRRFEDIPTEIVEKVKHYILDVTGCIVRASKEKQSQAVINVFKEQGGNPTASVFASGFKTSPANAAFINGTMGHIYDYDDDHREGTMHPSVSVFPAVFALAEKQRVTGKEFMRAFILGLEVMIRTGEAFLGKTYYQGFHPTGTCGVFGAALGSALILKLNSQQTTWALGLSGSFAAGTLEWATEGSWQKPIQAGEPAMSGVLCASLAQQNFVGARTIFDGPVGFVRAYSYQDTYDLGRLTENLGVKWEMKDTSIKVHACCRFAGPIADCAMKLFDQGVRADNVDSILAKVSNWAITALTQPAERKYRPKTHVDAQFSLPYVIALCIVRHRTGVDEFKEEVYRDPAIHALADKITAEVDPAAEAAYPKFYPSTLVARLKDGRTVEAHVDYPKGDPENPVSWRDLTHKFHQLTEIYFDQDRRGKIVDAVQKLEKIDDIAELADLLR